VFLDLDGNKVFTLSFGRGPVTVLAHSGWIGNFEDWIATLAPLSESWRTVVYDHRGAGETRVPVERISADALIDDVFRVMDALHIDRCVLGGFSLGTVTVLRAALRQPGRFSGLMLMNGNAGVQMPNASPVRRLPPSQWPGETFLDHLEWFADQCTPEPDSEHIRRWAVNILSRSTPGVADRIATMQPSEKIDWAMRLPELTLPTLLVHGEKDPRYSFELMQYLQSLLPNSKLVVMEGSGHLPMMTRPMDMAKVIDDFLRYIVAPSTQGANSSSP
jgi:pimeloyl-ACP methyl ester carboxylesterase